MIQKITCVPGGNPGIVAARYVAFAYCITNPPAFGGSAWYTYLTYRFAPPIRTVGSRLRIETVTSLWGCGRGGGHPTPALPPQPPRSPPPAGGPPARGEEPPRGAPRR